MRKPAGRVLSMLLVFSVLCTLVPAPAFAAQFETGDAGTGHAQTITLPVVEEGEEAPEPQGIGGGISTFALTPHQAETSYAYVGCDDIQVQKTYIYQPGTTDKLTEEPTENGILQMLDTDEEVVAASDAITYYSRENADDSGETQIYYISYAYLQNTGDIPAGTYTLRLAAGNQIYPCSGTVEVIGEEYLMLDDASVSGFYPGEASFDLSIRIYGFETEEDLQALSFTLLNPDGTVLARSTGAYRDLSTGYSDGAWHIYAQMLVDEGQEIESDKEYSLQISYIGSKTLVDAVGSVTNMAWTPSPEIVDFQVLDAQTGRIAVSLRYLTVGEGYRLTASEQWDGAAIASSSFTAVAATAEVELQLTRGGTPASMASYGNSIYFTLYENGSTYQEDSATLDNPYYNIQEEQLYFYPFAMKPDTKILDFWVEYHNGCSAYKGSGDVLSLRDSDGNEVARCDSMTLEQAGYSGKIRGTLTVTEELRDEMSCYVYLNGVQFDTVYVTTERHMSTSVRYTDYDSAFWMNFGQFPVEIDVLNSSGSGEFVFLDAEGERALSSGAVTGGVSEYDGYLCYQYTFTEEQFKALMPNESYQLVFVDGGEQDTIWQSLYRYDNEATVFDPANSGQVYINWYDLSAGDQDIEAQIYITSEDLRNLTRDALDALKNISLTDGQTNYQVESYTGYMEDEGYQDELLLHLDKPLEAGEYTAYYNGGEIDSYISVDEADNDTKPSIYGNDAQNGYATGVYLPENSTYTGKIYLGYTCVEETFSMELRGENNGDTQFLYFDKGILDKLEDGSYELWVFQDGKILDSVDLTILADISPIVTVNDEDGVWNDAGDPVMHTSEVRIEGSSMGAYGYLRWAGTEEALEEAEFEPYFTNRYYAYTLEGEDGPKTLYVELSKTGMADDPDNLIYDFDLWLCTDGDYDLRVPNEIQGVKDLDQRDEYTIHATTEVPAANVWVTFIDGEGNYASQQMTYDGPTDDGRYGFSLAFGLDTYDSVWDNGRQVYYRETNFIRVFATDLSEEYHQDESYRGNIMGEPVERVLIFGDPTSIILPQFRNGEEVFINQRTFTLYGYAAPGDTVAVTSSAVEQDTGTADENGYFSIDLSGLQDGSHTLTVSGSTSSIGAATARLTVDATPPVVDSVGFTFLDAGAAVIRWTCADTDVDHFEVYMNGRCLGQASADTFSYNVTASYDDGNFFTIRAIDKAGNIGEKTVSTADQEPPTAPSGLQVTGKTTTSLSLSWTAGTDNMGVAGYNIFAGEELLTATEGESTQCTISGLGMGTEYVLTVKTRDRAGNLSDEGAQLTASTVKLTLSAGTEKTYIVDEYAAHRIAIPVKVTADDSAYAVSLSKVELAYRSAGSESWISSGNTVGGESISWDISGREDGYLHMGSYELRITATDSNGGQVSSEYTVELKRDDEAPTVPGAPAAVSHSTTSITFTWEGSTDNVAVDRYEIYRGGAKVGESKTNTYTDTGLEMGKNYSYTVKAVDARGNTSDSSTAASLSTMVLSFDSVIEFESSYMMELQPNKQIDVWAKFKPEEGYIPNVTMTMEYKPAEAEAWTTVKLDVAATDVDLFQGHWDISGSDTGYLPEGSYVVRFAVTDGSATAYSEPKTVALTRDTVPPTVESISTNGDTVSGKDLSIRVRATDNVGVVQIKLSHAPQGSDAFTPIGETDANGSYTWDASQLPSGTYTIKAEAYDLRGNVGSKTIAQTIDNTPPAVPTDFTVTGTSRYIHVMWDAEYQPTTDFSHFNVYRALIQDGPFDRVSESSSIGYFDDGKTADAGKTYYYYVTAEDTYGNESGPTQVLSAALVADNESPTIGDMLPQNGATLRKSVSIRVTAADNYRLAKAVFSYRAEGSGEWNLIGEDVAEGAVNDAIFSVDWDISALSGGSYELKAEVYDDSINDVEENSGYTANAPAVITRTVTIQPYSAPVAPVLSAEAGYKTAVLSWTYGGNRDLLSYFNVYRIANGEKIYVTTVSADANGCTVEISAEGAQTFVVAARDKYGETAESSQITVSSLERENELPVAVILPETLTAAEGVPFTFSAASSTDNDEIVSYAWQFGDGNSGSGMSCQHTYADAGTYTVILTVTDACGNTDQAEAQIAVYDVTGSDADHALVILTVVNGYVEGTQAVAGADVKLYGEDFELSAMTDANGQAFFVAPLGDCTVSVMAGGYIAVSRAVAVTADEQGTFAQTIGLRPMSVSTVDGSLSVEEMTYDEILAAGIDVTDPDNNHVWKFAATLEFAAGPALPFELPVTGYFNGAGEFISGSGWGWTTVGGGGGGGGGGLNIGLFPISEKFVLVIYGEAHWLKEMYNVELLVINNSYTDNITDCVATLDLPEGLSLAAMTGAAQSERIELGTIAHKTGADDSANTAKATWYVRGDAEGEYDLTATVTGNAPEPFLNTFTTDEPVKVYAGSALKLFITAEDIAYRGKEYHVQFKLQNVSDKDLYNLSFGITGAEQFKVVQIGDGEAGFQLTEEDFGDGMTQSIDVLKPGGSITIDFSTTTWFNSILELADLGPLDVGYYLTNVFVTTLEGSTTTIPYEIEITHTSHGTFFEWLWDEVKDTTKGEFVDILDKTLFDEIPVVGTGLKVYKFLSEDSTDADSRAVITIENGYFTASNNFLRSRAMPQGAISVYTDAPEGSYEISADGKTMTITGTATIYVQGESAGNATMKVTTYADGQPNVHTLSYVVSGETGEAQEIILQAPQQSQAEVPLAGKTLQITFPYAMKDAQGNLVTDASNAVWTILGTDTTGLTIDKGVLTVDSTAKGGTYTVRLSLGENRYQEQTVTLTREGSSATTLKLYRDGQEIVERDTLVIPVSDASESHTYTARLLDQYGVEMAEEILWTVSDNTSSAACQNGTITLTRDTTAGSLTLTASVGATAVSVDITITNLVVDWSGVEEALNNTSYIYGDPNNKVSLPQTGTATAIETVEGTFSVVDGDAVQDAGERTITVNFTAGEGTYAGTVISRGFPIRIDRKPLTADMLTVTGSCTYTGSPVTPACSVVDGNLLDEDDYTVDYTDNINVGTAAVTVTGQGNYTGSVSKTFDIAPKALTDDMVGEITGELVYSGQAHTPEMILKYGALTLVKDTDYTVRYADNINAGTATATVTGQGNYTGSASKTFTITPKNLADEMVQPITGTFVYNGQAHTPAITVMDGGTPLVKDTDYSVSYSNNTNAGTASVTMTGQGNYAGTAHISFTIDKASLGELTPILTGTGEAGSVLAARLDGVPAGDYTWHWYYKADNASGYEEIADALGQNFYVLTWTGSNKEIYVEATALAEGNYEGTTLSSLPVQAARYAITGSVTISANEEVIQSSTTLTAELQIDPAVEVVYQWKLDGEPVVSAVGNTFTVPDDSVGKSVTVTVIPASDDFTGSITSAAVVVGKTALAGTLTLSLTDGIITATAENFVEGSFDIVWLRNGTVIAGASGFTYTVTDADKGADISAKAVSKGVYTGEIVAKSVAIAPTAPNAPTVTASAGSGYVNVSWKVSHNGGAAVTGYTLTVKNGDMTVETVELDGLAQKHTVDGLTNGITYTFEVTATNSAGTGAAGAAAATPRTSGGGSAGGSSTGGNSTGGSSISQDKETVTNPDGSVTTTVTNSDGSTTATTRAPNGSSSVVNIDKDGGVKVQVTVSEKALQQAGEQAVTLPVPAVSPAADKADTPTVTVDLPNGATATVEIPVTKGTASTVAVLVYDDGSEKVIKTSVSNATAVIVTLSDGDTVRLVDDRKVFSDVPDSYWGEEAIDFVTSRQLFVGTSATTFAPDMLMTRGMIAKVIYNLEEGTVPAAAAFTDTPEGLWYTDAVNWAAANGIVSGYGNGRFGPEDSITREQMAVILYNYATVKGYDTTASADLTAFTDHQLVSGWAQTAIKWAVASGLMQGYNNTLDPLGNASRAEVAQILANFIRSNAI